MELRVTLVMLDGVILMSILDFILLMFTPLDELMWPTSKDQFLHLMDKGLSFSAPFRHSSVFVYQTEEDSRNKQQRMDDVPRLRQNNRPCMHQRRETQAHLAEEAFIVSHRGDLLFPLSGGTVTF